jgi:hypothetical protein
MYKVPTKAQDGVGKVNKYTKMAVRAFPTSVANEY